MQLRILRLTGVGHNTAAHTSPDRSRSQYGCAYFACCQKFCLSNFDLSTSFNFIFPPTLFHSEIHLWFGELGFAMIMAFAVDRDLSVKLL